MLACRQMSAHIDETSGEGLNEIVLAALRTHRKELASKQMSFAFEADEFPCAGRAAEIDANRIEPCRVSVARRADVNADK
jgi:hypothetical protein